LFKCFGGYYLITYTKLPSMSIQPGQPAPDFTLHSSAKDTVTLSELKGKKVLLLFFPQAFTSVCTKELCGVRDNIALYNYGKTTVFGISVDSPFTLAKFKEDQGLNFTLLSDFNKEASTAYGAIYDNFIGWMHGVSKRAAFIVDEEGKISYAEVLENAGDVPDFEAINAVLEG